VPASRRRQHNRSSGLAHIGMTQDQEKEKRCQIQPCSGGLDPARQCKHSGEVKAKCSVSWRKKKGPVRAPFYTPPGRRRLWAGPGRGGQSSVLGQASAMAFSWRGKRAHISLFFLFFSKFYVLELY
jgi:hypothetical protein